MRKPRILRRAQDFYFDARPLSLRADKGEAGGECKERSPVERERFGAASHCSVVANLLKIRLDHFRESREGLRAVHPLHVDQLAVLDAPHEIMWRSLNGKALAVGELLIDFLILGRLFETGLERRCV